MEFTALRSVRDLGSCCTEGNALDWINLENGKSYIGSSVNLGKRMSNYFSILTLKAQIKISKSHIYRSLIKNGGCITFGTARKMDLWSIFPPSKFSLEGGTLASLECRRIEYCTVSSCIEREQYFIYFLNPEYNILKKAGSSFGYKPSEETKAKISIKLTGRTLTSEHIAKLRSRTLTLEQLLRWWSV